MGETPNEQNVDRAQVEAIINDSIRPALQMHGGDVTIASFEGDVLKINYQGACGGCPSAALGTLQMIQQVLQEQCGKNIVVERAS